MSACGICFTSVSSVCSGFLEFVVNPKRSEMRNTCVSTAILGWLKITEATTLAVLRPTPGSCCSNSVSAGTMPLKSVTSFCAMLAK